MLPTSISSATRSILRISSAPAHSKPSEAVIFIFVNGEEDDNGEEDGDDEDEDEDDGKDEDDEDDN